MNAVLYHPIRSKLINGTLFYSFEYFLFLNKFADVTFFLLDASDEEMAFYRQLLSDKYIIEDTIWCKVKSITRTSFALLHVDVLLVLSSRTYKSIKDFTFNTTRVLAYNTKGSNLNKKNNHIVYGWYDYQQVFDKQERLKFAFGFHRRYPNKGTYTYVSSIGENVSSMLPLLGISNPLPKRPNEPYSNLFSRINHVVYVHTGEPDTDNRIVVEAYFHGIPTTLLVGDYRDSVVERFETVQKEGIEPFQLTPEDIIVTDFLNECNRLL